MSNQQPLDKKKRQGVWEEIRRFEDPKSKVSLILSERIRGKHAYSIQIGLEDDLGFNKHITAPPPGAEHALRHILYSLVEAAEGVIAERKKNDGLS